MFAIEGTSTYLVVIKRLTLDVIGLPLVVTLFPNKIYTSLPTEYLGLNLGGFPAISRMQCLVYSILYMPIESVLPSRSNLVIAFSPFLTGYLPLV